MEQSKIIDTTETYHTPEDDPSSFLGPSWEEEALGAEAFQELPESPTNRAVDNIYRVTNPSGASLH